MISTFTATDTSDPLVSFLMLTPSQRAAAPVPLQALREKNIEEHACAFKTFKFTREGNVLSEAVRSRLSEFLDFMWRQTALEFPVDRVDMRLCVPDAKFRHLINAAPDGHETASASSGSSSSSTRRRAHTESGGSGDGEALLSELHGLFDEIPGTSGRAKKIALRMTRSPSRGCIPFHCDGAYATGTVQVALNDASEYEGGQLCFFVNGALTVLDRPAGSVCQHPPRVLHAVTALTGGTRKSLFVVDERNGLGEGGVVIVTEAQVANFLASIQSGQAAATSAKRSREI
mmetsp:Transcript_32826/g.71604  ORF Transcript_32826/g.71604 Transcript_32826/m.71604 type:complete len:288 (-) Transcript_32826:276-1139(-)